MAVATIIAKPVVDLARIGRSVVGTLTKALLAAQVAQMCRALNRLSDRQLAEIGISRAEIPAHARKLLMTGEA